MKKRVQLTSLLLALAMILMLAACGSGSSSSSGSSTAAETSEATQETVQETQEEPEEAPEEAPADDEAEAPEASTPEEASAPEEEEAVATSDTEIIRTYTEAESLPLVDEPVTLTAWDYVVPPVMAVIDDYGTDGQVYAELQARTGVTLNFTTANLLTASDSMSLMIAANELPDLIFNFGMFNSNNLDDLIDGDIIVDFTDYEDIMPNYFDILNNNPSIARDVYTEGGGVCLAENIQDSLIPSSGPAIRQDWLDADGLEVPVTVDDLHEVLLAFQAQNDCSYPFWIAANGNSSLNSAFGVSVNGDNNSLGGWIYQDDQVQYCVPMDGFRDYIQLMTDWYAEGLISPDFVSQPMNNTAADDEIVGNASGFFTTSVNGLTNLSGYEPDSDVEPIRAVVLNEGDLNGFDDAGTSRVSKGGAAVACSCPDVELALRILDYLYSDDGIILSNYGVEGVTFEYEDGEPVLTDLVTNNPDMDFTLALIKYTSSTPASICINSRNFLGYTDAQVQAIDLWLRNTTSTQAPGALWTTDAQTEYSGIMNDLGSYVSTACLQFITGSKSMDEWDSFVAEATSSFDIDRATELYQEAVDAYLAIGT
jgi:putative aldouronate transport system substrate-binding protein